VFCLLLFVMPLKVYSSGGKNNSTNDTMSRHP
jgi:hypothetical protein